MGKPLELSGQKFGRLTVISRTNERNKDGRFLHLCQCDCGNEVRASGSGLKSGNTRSCGCYQKDRAKQYETTHGDSVKGRVASEYKTWQAIKNRCCNPRCEDYRLYGERGIKVCESWLNSYETFLKDMGRKPTPNHTIDRIDPNKDYSADNCRWLPNEEQAATRRNIVLHEYNGQMITLSAIAKKLDLCRTLLLRKVNKEQMRLEDAIMYCKTRRKPH